MPFHQEGPNEDNYCLEVMKEESIHCTFFEKIQLMITELVKASKSKVEVLALPIALGKSDSECHLQLIY